MDLNTEENLINREIIRKFESDFLNKLKESSKADFLIVKNYLRLKDSQVGQLQQDNEAMRKTFQNIIRFGYRR